MTYNPQTYIDMILGTGILLFGIVGGNLLAHKIISFFTDDEELNIIYLFMYLLILVVIVIIIRCILEAIIMNILIKDAVLNLAGPLIGVSSLYLNKSINNFVKGILR